MTSYGMCAGAVLDQQRGRGRGHHHLNHAECSLNRAECSLNFAECFLNQAYYHHHCHHDSATITLTCAGAVLDRQSGRGGGHHGERKT